MDEKDEEFRLNDFKEDEEDFDEKFWVNEKLIESRLILILEVYGGKI